MSKEQGKPSLREQVRIYKSTLSGDALAKFNEVFKEKEEALTLKKAFVAAKEAAQEVIKNKK